MPERVEVTVIRNGGRDYMEVATQWEMIVASLLKEREVYAKKNDAEGVAAVNAELAYMKYVEEQ